MDLVPASEVAIKPPRPRLVLVVSAALFAVLAAIVAYGGVAVAFTLATANGNARAVAASGFFVLGALGAPVTTGVYLTRRRGWNRWRAVRFAAITMLVVHAALLPVALAALSM